MFNSESRLNLEFLMIDFGIHGFTTADYKAVKLHKSLARVSTRAKRGLGQGVELAIHAESKFEACETTGTQGRRRI